MELLLGLALSLVLYLLVRGLWATVGDVWAWRHQPVIAPNAGPYGLFALAQGWREVSNDDDDE